MCVCVVSAVHKEYGGNKQWLWTVVQGRCQKAVRQDGEMEKREGTATWGLDGKRRGVSRSTELFLSLLSTPSSWTGPVSITDGD